MKKTLTLILTTGAFLLAAEADQIIAKTSESYKNIKSFSAQFDRKTCNTMEEVCQLSQGKIVYQEPNLFRVEISSPEKEIYVSDGSYLWVYVPSRQEVLKQSIKDSKMVLSPRFFLDEFKEQFTCELDKDEAKVWEVKLSPRDETYFLEDVILTIDKKTYKVLGFATFDHNKTHIGFSFAKLILNPKVSPKAFTFKVPRGVKVVGE